jgi:hypothetical protein
MCKKLKQAGKLILDMGYFKNEHARSSTYVAGHEEAVAVVMESVGFKRFEREDFPELKRNDLKRWWEAGFGPELDQTLINQPKGSFILQPGGTQSFPDILVKDFKGRIVAVECKSGNKGTHPMWNDSIPKPGAVYIMSSGRTDSTTMFMGQDVITPEEADVIAKYNKMFEDLKQQCKAEMTLTHNKNRGWLYSHRRQFFQYGGQEKTNYFTHTDRAQCEKSVLDFMNL